MPAFNADSFISTAIDSILSQSFQNWELLIADDGSSDKTKNIIDAYKDNRIKTFHNKENLGYLKSCNKLFDHCCGDYITFQDADDYSKKDRIALQLKAFSEDKNLAICGTQIFHEGKSNIEPRYYPLEDDEIKKTLLDIFPFCGATIMITKEVLKKYGGYNEIFDRIGSEDYEWAGRIVKENKGRNLEEKTYCYRYNPKSVTKNINSPGFHVSSVIAREMIKGKIINIEEGYAMKEKLLKSYSNDTSLLLRKNCDLYAYHQNFRGLRNSAFKAFYKNPFKLINIKYFLGSFLRYKIFIK